MITAFRAGLALAAAGAVWAGLLFAGAEREAASGALGPSEAMDMQVRLEGPGLGYYTVHMPEYSGEELFVRVTDPGGNVIREEAVGTRMSVGYFDHAGSGAHAVRIVNISGVEALVEAEAGAADSRGMIPAGALLVSGVLVMMGAAYIRIRGYSTAQPDENIS